MRLKLKLKKIIQSLLLIIGFSIPFLVGSFSKDYYIEDAAEYCASLVDSDEVVGSHLAITVSANGDITLPDSTNEFHNLYGVFKQRNLTFSSMINGNHERKVYLKCDPNNCLSFMYMGPISSIEYNNHFKHYIYPIEVMFKDKNNYNVGRNCVYISQSQAEKILRSKNINKKVYEPSDFESLVGTLFDVEVDGTTYDFVIQNIYFEQNYYFEGIHEAFGDFMVCSYYLPDNLRKSQVNAYYLNNVAYQNEYFMKYMKALYDTSNYRFNINKNNVNASIDENRLFRFIEEMNYNPLIITLFSFVSISLVVLSFFLGGGNILYYMILILVPYAFFYFMYNAFNLGLLFSNFSRLFYIFEYLGFVILSLGIAHLIRRKNREKQYFETITI